MPSTEKEGTCWHLRLRPSQQEGLRDMVVRMSLSQLGSREGVGQGRGRGQTGREAEETFSLALQQRHQEENQAGQRHSGVGWN